MRSDAARGPLSAVPAWLLQTAAVIACGLVIAAGVWLFGEFIERLTVVVVPVLLALLVAAVFHPVVARLQHPRLPEWVVPLLVALIVLAVIIGAAAFASTRVAAQLPELRDQAVQLRQDLSQRLGIDLPQIPGVHGQPSSSSDSSSAPGSSGARQAAVEALSIGTEILVGLFLTLALAFLFLKDGPQMWQWALEHTGERIRDPIDAAGRAAWGTLGTYVRGLTIVALFDAVAIAIGLAFLGVPLLVTLALLQFFGSYIPTFGAFVAGAVAVAVALVSGGIVTAALTLALVVAVQQIGNNIIEPWVMGRTLPLHAAVVLITVTAGAVLWGIAGALLFVPLAAAVSAGAHALREHRSTGESEPSWR